MKVLIACEYSGAMREAFKALGHNAWSCDLLPAEDGSKHHYQDDIKAVLRFTSDWDLMIAHPSCTYLTRAGYHWCNKPDSGELPLKGEPRRQAMREAADFFKFLLGQDIPRIAVENPIPICHAGLPDYSQIVQPWWFGVPQFKATCWWLKGLPLLEPSNPLTPPARGTQEHKDWSSIHRMSPGKNRWKERSRTDPRVSAAIADQWGLL
jgi:hypothetical protein